MPRAHVHRWERVSTRGVGAKALIHERCKCGSDRERQATSDEGRRLKLNWTRFLKRSESLHSAWRPVQKLLERYGRSTDQKSKLKLMDKMEALQKRFPDRIRYVKVDDSAHAGSDLWFISHKCEAEELLVEYWGTTVLYIGQCTDDPPVTFFLYPDSHLQSLKKVINEIDKEQRAVNRRGRILRKEEDPL